MLSTPRSHHRRRVHPGDDALRPLVHQQAERPQGLLRRRPQRRLVPCAHQHRCHRDECGHVPVGAGPRLRGRSVEGELHVPATVAGLHHRPVRRRVVPAAAVHERRTFLGLSKSCGSGSTPAVQRVASGLFLFTRTIADGLRIFLTALLLRYVGISVHRSGAARRLRHHRLHLPRRHESGPLDRPHPVRHQDRRSRPRGLLRH